MLDYFNNRLRSIESIIERIFAAPTFPIYDIDNLPQDAIEGQIVLSINHSINWFYEGNWFTHAGTLSTVGDIPQSAIEGQIVIGVDNSLNWFVDGDWYGASGFPVTGNPPQDSVPGQLVVGTNTLAWYVNDAWYGFRG